MRCTTLALCELDEGLEAVLRDGRDSLSAGANGGDGGRREVFLDILDVDLWSERVIQKPRMRLGLDAPAAP